MSEPPDNIGPPEHARGDTPEPGDDDPTLKREPVDTSAKTQPNPGSQSPADSIPLASPVPKEPGDPDMIGPYRILGRIGSGGMGVVYRAEQASPKRLVALKVIRGHAVSKDTLRRFKLESQILGSLRHPGIAQIYEAGTWSTPEGDLPYYAMEFVPNAKTLSEWVYNETLDTKAILTLFTSICQAVGHAHLKGVIHRDLKPGNILITTDGRAKIIDFGVARSTDPELAITTLETAVGVLIGTLQYMSPEQCGGDPFEVDTRSDVYALGVILYELLCGMPPYDVRGRAIQAALKVVQQDQPVQPSSIDRRLRGDVEIITLKALEKSRDRRYQGAIEFSADIQRYLDGLPIEAVRPTMIYRVKKYVRRHRLGTTIAALLLLSAIVGLVAAWQWSRADAARLERNRMVAELIDFYMVDHYQAISRLAGSQAARELIIERSMEYLQQLRQDAVDDADLQLILSSGLQAIGNNHWSMRMGSRGRLAQAVQAWEESMKALDVLLADSPGTIRFVMPAIQVRTLLFNGYHRLGRADEAGVILLQANRLLDSLGDVLASPERSHLAFHVWVDRAEHVRRGGMDVGGASADEMELLERTLSHAAAMRSRWPNVNSIRRDESIARNRLGGLHARRGEHEAALGQYQQSLQLREARLEDEPQGNTEQRDVMNARRYVAQSLIKLNRTDVALGTYADSILPMARSLPEQNRNADGSTDQRAVRDLALVLREYGDVLVVVERHGEAVVVLVESLGLWEGLSDATPDDLDLVWDAGRAGGSLAGVHMSLDQSMDARTVLDRVQRRLDRGFRVAPDHARLKQVQAYFDALRGAM